MSDKKTCRECPYSAPGKYCWAAPLANGTCYAECPARTSERRLREENENLRGVLREARGAIERPDPPGHVMLSIQDLEGLMEAYFQNPPDKPTRTQVTMLEDMLREAVLTARRYARQVLTQPTEPQTKGGKE